MLLKDLSKKYELGRTTIKSRIIEMFGEKGIRNYVALKKYLQGKNVDEVLKNLG
ncbi:MAG: hypothetical protein BAJALOKI2v1_840001 [Promethearchaeota archaeon]|nr:MAG: hypothetical protein BAJALOKI2v1_840001 [Candidatus Lokiarchaeota archaeon]